MLPKAPDWFNKLPIIITGLAKLPIARQGTKGRASRQREELKVRIWRGRKSQQDMEGIRLTEWRGRKEPYGKTDE